MADKDTTETVFEAAKVGNTAAIRELLCNRSSEVVEQIVNAKTDGATPLIIAALHGHAGVVEYLVESCFADVELKGSAELLSPPVMRIHEGSPLYYVASEGRLDIVKILIRNSAEVDSRIDGLSTPLRIACIHGHYQVVKFLVESNSNVNQMEIDETTPLHAASRWNRPAICQYLIKNFAQITRDNKG